MLPGLGKLAGDVWERRPLVLITKAWLLLMGFEAEAETGTRRVQVWKKCLFEEEEEEEEEDRLILKGWRVKEGLGVVLRKPIKKENL